MNNRDTPIEIYNWIEYICLSIVVIFLFAMVQPLLIFIVGVSFSIFYRNNIQKYFKFTVTYIITFYIFISLNFLKQDNYVLTIGTLTIILSFILFYVIKLYKEGKTIWNS